jgi:uncharacterized phage protein (TIGR02220 family)
MGTKQVNLRLDRDLISKYQSMADDNDRERAYYMKKALEEYLSPKPIKAKGAGEKGLVSVKNDKADFVINYLNSKAGTAYRYSESSRKDINARLSDGFSVSDCTLVIDKKCLEWIGTDMAKYLRPQTLFSKSKFEGYLNQIASPENQGGNHAPRKLSLAEQSELESRTVLAMCEAEEAGYSSLEAYESALRSQVGLKSGRDTRGEELHGQLLTLVPEDGEANR